MSGVDSVLVLASLHIYFIWTINLIAGRNVYWTDDALGQVSVARMDAPSARLVLLRDQNFNPRSIALDPANG